MDEPILTGGCVCGNVRYRVTGTAKSVEHCHCTMCRRAHGALYASGALIDASQLKINAGEEGLASYQSSPGNWRRFCRRCGANCSWSLNIFPESSITEQPPSMRARTGDTPPDVSAIFTCLRRHPGNRSTTGCRATMTCRRVWDLGWSEVSRLAKYACCTMLASELTCIGRELRLAPWRSL